MQLADISRSLPYVQPPLMELEPLLILVVTNSSNDFTCDLCFNYFMCKIRAEINHFLTTHYANHDIGSSIDIPVELLKLEYTNFITITFDNTILSFNV